MVLARCWPQNICIPPYKFSPLLSPWSQWIIQNNLYILLRSSGLGLATVQDLISANAYISIVDRSPPPADLPTSQIKFFETDITKLEQVERAVDGTVEWTAATGAPLGGVINCAGVGTAAKIIDAHNEPHPLDLWDFTIAVNLTGTFNLTRLELRHLVKVAPEDGPDGERGVVVLVSSAAAVSREILSAFSQPSDEPSICCSSKDSRGRPLMQRRKARCARWRYPWLATSPATLSAS